jgi:hypothetical protein
MFAHKGAPPGAQVRGVAATREEGYPAAIQAKKITAEDAERGIHLARCIVEQWRWIIDKALPPCPEFDSRPSSGARPIGSARLPRGSRPTKPPRS